MRRNYWPTREEIAARYPRLLKSMRWAGILADGEAIGALVMHKLGDNYAGEAVNHFGGCKAVIRAGIRCRHYVRTLNVRPVLA